MLFPKKQTLSSIGESKGEEVISLNRSIQALELDSNAWGRSQGTLG
jgi:hypothetical protein